MPAGVHGGTMQIPKWLYERLDDDDFGRSRDEYELVLVHEELGEK